MKNSFFYVVVFSSFLFACSVGKTIDSSSKKTKPKLSKILERKSARKYKQKATWYNKKYTVWYHQGTLNIATKKKKSKGYFPTLDQFKSGSSIIDKYTFLRGVKANSLNDLEDSLKVRDFYQDVLIRPDEKKKFSLIKSKIETKEETLRVDTKYTYYEIQQEYVSLLDKTEVIFKKNYNYVYFSPKGSLIVSSTDKNWLNSFVDLLIKIKQ